ncbi:HAMP domain-containing sensor histidine kinase [Spirosoma sp. SC4-14]|uniref:sensor histidine kinase n=1 Tax=Spirosoma sp. SC4-14 TaxID=3128900 RepID=UPI0030CFFD90
MNLRSRIVLAITVVFGAISLLAGWFMLLRAEKSLQIAFDRAIQTRAGWLLSQVSPDPIVLPLPAETEKMKVCYQAYGETHTLFQSPDFPDQSGMAYDSRHQLHWYQSVTVQTTPFQLPNGLTSLTLAVPKDSLVQDMIQLRWVFGVGWLISLGLAFVGGYIVAGWLLKPIQAIVRQAGKITNAATIESIELPRTHDELYRLTDTLNQMLARIRESAELQRNFFGAAAHELRTPLTIMKTGLEVTLNNPQIEPETVSLLTGQLDDVRRLTRLLDEFLTLSHPDVERRTLKKAMVSLPSLVKNCIRQLQSIADEYDVKIELDVPNQEIEMLMTDPVKLEQVLLNLIENAVKYAVGGSIVFVLLRWDSVPVVVVQNQTHNETGPVLDLIQPYFRADPLKEGHGLGLWISHQLTNLLKGQLAIRWANFQFISTLTLPKKID